MIEDIPEIWIDVEGFEGLYQVSNIGRVKSLNRVTQRPNQFPQKTKDRILKVSTSAYGYFMYVLSKNGKHHTRFMHRMIAIAFIPNPENKKTVNHINGVKKDNSIGNLEWATDSEQHYHAYSMGLKKCHRLKIFNQGIEIKGCETITQVSNYLNIKRSSAYDKIITKGIREINNIKIMVI